eukprot:CAMPEP_0198204552 /NCGR_PEP_ID=MMETSP1445-20131203/7970_1 /TAXON_ID=36898 /ORGANISM="Pyramimonas sp., Strain CCMP2087" /LENGTH=161 /DNA_ID=CAMNT_0043876477 /DNA_START=91 /DNA_END=573 /DNA_ORIENTATION=-
MSIPRGDVKETLLQRAQTLVDELLQDPLLADLPKDVHIDEVEACIASEEGTPFTIHVKRFDGKTLDVALPQAADVRMLKFAVQRAISKLREGSSCRPISWRYTWERYCLVYVKHSQRIRLLDDSHPLEDYGIAGEDQIMFARNLLSRDVPGGRRHVRAKRW